MGAGGGSKALLLPLRAYAFAVSLLFISLAVAAERVETHPRTSAAADDAALGETHTYRQIDGDGSVSDFQWSCTGLDPVTIESDSDQERFLNVCRADGGTLRWKVERSDGSVNARRERNAIVFGGELDGASVDRTVKIDEVPWYQALSYSLRQRVLDGGLPVTFWMVRPDTLEPVKLRADKESNEVITLSGRELPCVRLRVTGTGFTGRFWHCFYWFRESDGLFMRYEGLFGIPGLPKSRIEWHPDPAEEGPGPA
jgi:hypothetical protein